MARNINGKLLTLSLALAAGCQHSFKHGRQGNFCEPGREIHVNAPPQKVVVNLPAGDEKCAPGAPPCEKPKEPSAPAKAQGEPEPEKAKAQGAPQQAQPQQFQPAGAAAMAGGMQLPPYAAIPTLRGGVALSLSCDWIHIPIPIPRLRTVEAPPETSTAYVGMGASAMGAMPYAAPAMMAPPQYQMAQMEAAQQQQCYTPEQIAAAMALIRRQQGASGAGAAAAASSGYEAELKKREKELEEKAERLQKATDKLDKLLKDKGGASMQAPALPRTDWESNDPWKQTANYRRGDWK